MKEENKKKNSEFGKGFVYNLILFAAHFERYDEKFERYYEKEGLKGMERSLWFNAASDHLYELEVPSKWKDKEIGRLALELQDLALEIGHGNRMGDKSEQVEKDFDRVVRMTKDLGLLIDKELGIDAIKGDWE